MARIQTVEAQGPPEASRWRWPPGAVRLRRAPGPREMQACGSPSTTSGTGGRSPGMTLRRSWTRCSASPAAAPPTRPAPRTPCGRPWRPPANATQDRWGRLRSFRACLEPLDLLGDEPITGRRVLDLLWAAARLQAAGFGVSIALEEPVSLERLMVAGRRILEMPDGERLLARSARLAATVAGQFDSPNGPADPPGRCGTPGRRPPRPRTAAPGRPGGREPTGSSAAWRPAGVPGRR